MATAMSRTEFESDAHAPESGLPDDLLLIVAGTETPSSRRALPRLSAELDLARQNRRVLALVLFQGGRPSTAPGRVADAATDRTTAAHAGPVPEEARPRSAALAALLREATRDFDAVTHAPSQQWCLVAMPEVTETEAVQATRRLQKVCAATLVSPVRTGLALFPRDGHTLEALVCHALRDADAVGAPRVVLKADRRQAPLSLVRNPRSAAADTEG